MQATASKRVAEYAAAEKTMGADAARKAAEIDALKEEISELEAKLAALGGDPAAASSGAGAAAGSKAAKPKKGSAGAATAASAPSSTAAAAAVTLDDAERAEYTQLKGIERQRTADLREQLDRLGREQGQEEAAAASIKSNLDALLARKGTSTGPFPFV